MPPQIPPSPGSDTITTHRENPADLNADLAAAALAKDLFEKLGKPSVISKKFAVTRGFLRAINHTDTNKTGLDVSLMLAIMDNVADDSVNVDGKWFERILSYLMKPKYIISGIPQQGNQFDEQQPNWFVRQWRSITGNGGETNGASK